MSPRITSKNLSYNSSLPPFLAALHTQASRATGPDPLAAAQRRCARKRSGSEEAEDAPLVVDHGGNALSGQVDQDGVTKGDSAAGGDGHEPKHVQPAAKPEKRQVEAKSALGGRKRKVGKVVVVDVADDSPHKHELDHKTEAPAGKKVKTRARKIKLSFDDDQG